MEEKKAYLQSKRKIRFSSATLTRAESRRRSLALLLLLRIMCEVKAWKRFTLPLPVILKRFFALLCVFIFGILPDFKERKGTAPFLECQTYSTFFWYAKHSILAGC